MKKYPVNARAIASLILVGFIAFTSYGQQSKNSLKLADQYFAAGEYYTAAHLYEQFLNPPKNQRPVSDFPLNAKKIPVTPQGAARIQVLFKQAESYRLSHYWTKAASVYQEVLKSEPSHTEALFQYAICERSLGNYEKAMEALNQITKSSQSRGYWKEAAESELQTLAFIQKELARPDSVLINAQKVTVDQSSERGGYAAIQVEGEQYLITSTQTDSVQTTGINPHHSRLYYATMVEGNLQQLKAVSLNTDNLSHQGAATVSADGQNLFFTQWRLENGRTVSSIYHATKQGDAWSAPVMLASVNQVGYNSKQPFCSADGKYLFFSSDRPGGLGGFDIWYAPITDGKPGTPVNAGSLINTKNDEQSPFFHKRSNTLVFASNGHGGMGGFDLIAAKGKIGEWQEPENMGYPVNSPRDDVYFFSKESNNLLTSALISSDRGSGCCLETYRISKAAKGKNLMGYVRHCKDSTPIANVQVILKDAVGKTAEVTTDENGRYVFEKVNSYQDPSIIINKELFKESITAVNVEKTDETDLLTDKLINSDICIEERLVIKAENVVTVYFDFDRHNLKDPALAKLDSIFTVLMDEPQATIQISGYTDGLGTEEYNKKLSDRRARACADYLIAKGIDTARISFESFGACCPVEMEKINDRDNPDGRALNRRALINVKKD